MTGIGEKTGAILGLCVAVALGTGDGVNVAVGMMVAVAVGVCDAVGVPKGDAIADGAMAVHALVSRQRKMTAKDIFVIGSLLIK